MPRIHNTGMKMGPTGRSVGREFPAALSGLLLGGVSTQGSAAPGSTLGYIPAAASRLKVFAILPGTNVIHNTLERLFSEKLCPVFLLSA